MLPMGLRYGLLRTAIVMQQRYVSLSLAGRGVRAAEGTRLEIAYLPKGGSRVRIPPSPSLASLSGGGLRRRFRAASGKREGWASYCVEARPSVLAADRLAEDSFLLALEQKCDQVVELFLRQFLAEVLGHDAGRVVGRDLLVRVDDRLTHERRVLALKRLVEIRPD